MIEEAIEKARAYSDNKDKIDAYYDGYVACYLKLNKRLKAEHTRGEIDFVNMHCNSSCKKVKELEDKIEHLTKHLEPQSMSALFEQVEEEVKQKQRIEELEAQIEQNKIDLAISEHDREHNDYELTEVYKKIEKLQAQIEKMKCCGNCGHFKQKTYRGEFHTQCDFDWNDVYGEYGACNKWEIKEK